MDAVYYFAYGHHIDPVYLKQLGIHIYETIPAVLPHYRFAFNVLEDEWFRFEKRGIANITPEKGCQAEGVVYEIDESVLPVLDEAFGVERLKYYRKQVQVRCEDGSVRLALCYAGWPDVTSKGLLPSVRYLRKLVDAAGESRISTHFRQWLRSHPVAW